MNVINLSLKKNNSEYCSFGSLNQLLHKKVDLTFERQIALINDIAKGMFHLATEGIVSFFFFFALFFLKEIFLLCFEMKHRYIRIWPLEMFSLLITLKLKLEVTDDGLFLWLFFFPSNFRFWTC